MHDYRTVVEKGLVELIKHFVAFPYDFLYESDVKCFLYSLLLPQILAGERMVVPHDEKGGYPSVMTTILKTEYPSNERFDIALLDEAQKSKNNKWLQPVAFALELKLRQSPDADRSAEIIGDFQMLNSYSETSPNHTDNFFGCALILYHSALDFKRRGGLYHYVDTTNHEPGTAMLVDKPITGLIVLPGEKPNVLRFTPKME